MGHAHSLSRNPRQVATTDQVNGPKRDAEAKHRFQSNGKESDTEWPNRFRTCGGKTSHQPQEAYEAKFAATATLYGR